ncbi:MAG: hypothetical protein QXP55_03135 [Nitrososphaerales archaeon]
MYGFPIFCPKNTIKLPKASVRSSKSPIGYTRLKNKTIGSSSKLNIGYMTKYKIKKDDKKIILFIATSFFLETKGKLNILKYPKKAIKKGA